MFKYQLVDFNCIVVGEKLLPFCSGSCVTIYLGQKIPHTGPASMDLKQCAPSIAGSILHRPPLRRNRVLRFRCSVPITDIASQRRDGTTPQQTARSQPAHRRSRQKRICCKAWAERAGAAPAVRHSKPKYRPIPTHLRTAILPKRVMRFGVENGFSVEYYKLIEGAVTKRVRSRFRFVDLTFAAVDSATRLASFGKLQSPLLDNCALILRKRAGGY